MPRRFHTARSIVWRYGVTNRSEPEGALASSNILQSLMESSSDLIFIKDTALRMVLCNSVLARALGQRPEETYGKTDIENGWSPELVMGNPQKGIKGWQEDDIAALAGSTVRAAQEPVEIAGETRYYDTVKLPLRNEEGTIMGLIGIARDITERTRVEEELRKSEEGYRSLFQNMLNGFAYCRMIFEDNKPQDFIYLEVNGAFETLTGLRNVVGKKVTEVIPGIRESNPELFEVYGRVSLSGTPERLETYVPELKIWFSISVYCPQREHFVAIFDNITDRKRLQHSLEQERSLLLTLINSLHDLVYVKDREGRYILANRAEADFRGVQDPAQLIGKTDSDFHSPDIADKYRTDDRRVIEEGIELVGMEELGRSAQGELRWLLTTKVPLREEAGAVVGLVGSSHDITHRKLTEQKQQEQAALLDITTDAILVRDMRNRILYWNKSATRIFGWSREEALGKDANDLLNSPAHAEELMKASSIVMEKGQWSGDLHARTKDGRELIVEASLTLIRDSQGTPTGILSVNTDVTERRAVQSQLLRVQRLESLGTLAGGIAHDLNNVLSPYSWGSKA